MFNMNTDKIAELERQIEYNQQILNNNQMKLKKDRDQIDKNNEIIAQK